MPDKEKSAAEKISRLRAQYVQGLSERFAELNLAYITTIESGNVVEDIRQLEVLSHTLCGSSGTFGFGDIAGICRRIESLCSLLRRDITNTMAMNEISKSIGQLEEAILAPRLISEPQLLEVLQPAGLKYTDKLIYLLDDDDCLAGLQKSKLEEFGYEVKTYQQLDDFCAAIKQEIPEAVIIDMVLGKDNGTDALNFLDEHLAMHVPSIMISSQPDFVTRLQVVKAGADAFLTKPLEADDVIDALDVLIGDKNSEPFKILIVDDIESMLDYYRIILERAGMVCATTSNPAEIMQTLLEFEPELILMDLHMPACRGDELAKVIHQEKKYAGLPIIYLSSETNMKEQLAAMQMAGDGFLIKPIRPSHLVGAISARTRRYRRIRSFMQNDSLTGLLNHSSLKTALKKECARASRNQTRFCFAMVDIDHFKQVNDRHGHAAGDMVLKNLSRLFKQRLRITDIVGRYGGEEFGVIMADTELGDGDKILNELLEIVRKMQFKLDDEMIDISFSAGLAAYPESKTAEDLCTAADKLLYEAKITGRNKVLAHRQTIEQVKASN